MQQIIHRYKTLAFVAISVVSISLSAVAQGNNNSDSNQGIDQIRSEISSKTISLDIKDTPFREVINLIRQRVSFNIIIDDEVEKMFKSGGAGAAAGGQGGGFGGGDSGGGGFGSDSGSDSGGGGFGSSSGSSDSGGGGFGSSGNSGGGSGSSGNNSSGGGFGSGSGNNSGGGFGSSGDSGGGGFGSGSSSGGGGFGSSSGSGGDSGGGFGSGSGGAAGGAGAAGAGVGGVGQQSIDENVSITLNEVTIERALKIILSMKNLTAVYKNGIVNIVPEGKARQYDIRFYDVRDLQYELKDFKAPELRFQAGSMSGSGSGSGSGSQNQKFLGGGLYEEDSGKSGRQIITNKEEFQKLIKQNIGNKSDWQKPASMRMTNGILVVNQTPEMHGEISFLINRLRQFK